MGDKQAKGKEEAKERQDRELIELLNELRVALPGVQVLFAFLLTVPFSQGYTSITPAQKNVYFITFLCTAASTALLIAPSAYHRVQWREGDKERMLRLGNGLAVGGLVFLALAITGVVFVITDLVIGGSFTPICTALSASVFALLWFVVPVSRRLRS
ncbi:MAG: hypothetical protein H0T12_03725 [Actinobacteria bacterium]|nr:hypothetical protein [Actinomycetota bacterium]